MSETSKALQIEDISFLITDSLIFIYSDIGLMNEELGLYPFLSAKENLELITLRHNCNYTSSELETFISNYKLDNTMNVSKFSTGMKKKLSFLGTLLHKPRLFLLDEPFSGVDPIAQKFLINQIKETSTDENAFVIVNHDLASTMKFCNKFLIIRDGEIVFYSDKPDDINNLEKIYQEYSE